MYLDLLHYSIGYLYSIVAGHFLISWFSKTAWSVLEGNSESDKDKQQRWATALAGTIDRIIYTSSLLFAAKEFIAVWLAFKIASQWNKWDDEKEPHKARAFFHLFVIGTGFSLMYGVIGGLLVEWLQQGEYIPATAFPVALILLNLSFVLIADRSKKNTGKKR